MFIASLWPGTFILHSRVKYFCTGFFSLYNSLNNTFPTASTKIFLLQQSPWKFHRLLRYTMYISLIYIFMVNVLKILTLTRRILLWENLIHLISIGIFKKIYQVIQKLTLKKYIKYHEKKQWGFASIYLENFIMITFNTGFW